MVSLKSLLPTLPLFLLATSQPIDIDTPTDTSGALEERGLGWLENSRGTEAYRCEYFPNPFFEKIHLAGRNSSHSEREFKKAAKKAGAVTGWKWKETGEEGGFDVKVRSGFSFPLSLFWLVVVTD